MSLATMFLADPAGAAPDSHPCASIAKDAERLACYDKAFGAADAPSKGAPAKQDFGLPAKKAYPTEAEKKDLAISAVISSVERRRDGKFVVTLDNGQTWLQSENDSRIDVKAGDTVNVRRAALGSYLLSNRDGLATRVKRVN
jgi:hypothetical protein